MYHDAPLYTNNLFSQTTKSEIIELERNSRGQSSSKVWYTFKVGRTTASIMKSVIQTNHAMPSQSLSRRICYPVPRRIQVFH